MNRLVQCGKRRHSGDMEGASEALRCVEGVVGERAKTRLTGKNSFPTVIPQAGRSDLSRDSKQGLRTVITARSSTQVCCFPLSTDYRPTSGFLADAKVAPHGPMISRRGLLVGRLGVALRLDGFIPRQFRSFSSDHSDHTMGHN